MKHLLKLLLVLLPGLSFSQDMIFTPIAKKQADSEQLTLRHTNNDTVKMLIYHDLTGYYILTDLQVALSYLNQTGALARKVKQPLWEAFDLDGLSYVNSTLGNYSEALKFANAGIKILENDACEKNIWGIRHFAKDGDPHKARMYVLANLKQKLADLYLATGNNAKYLSINFEALKIAESVDDKVGLSFYDGDLGGYYYQANRLDSAIFFANRKSDDITASGYKIFQGNNFLLFGGIYLKKGDVNTAKKYFFESVRSGREQNNLPVIPQGYAALSYLYRSIGKSDSAIYYAASAVNNFKALGDKRGLNDAYAKLSDAYKAKGQTDSAFLYLQRTRVLSDSLNSVELSKISQYLNVGFNEQLRIDELEKEKAAAQTRLRTYVFAAALGVLLLLSGIFYRNNQQKQKVNNILSRQKEEIESQRDNLENTLTNLKTTQTQLIQSEKMASLGELTAGIAHEIQNPLNFVNNFSEVSKELMDELGEELDKGDTKEAKVISRYVIQNLEKIVHHGKRADDIVKGMLQHSQSGSGKKEPTNINALADEYMRLAYHGLRAKDKSFNAEMVIHFAADLPKIQVIGQDMGRVMLNLFNNAFYAVNKKQKTAGADYKPEVAVTTSSQNGQVIISVKDNGIGIPNNIKEKIMQPFFTTKPTGEGTGLGLSLTYDMVVKGHGGSIKVDSVENSFTEITVTVPLI